MARPTNRDQRRAQITRAFERVLAQHGVGAATIQAVADEAEVAPGLIHHHFRDKEDLFEALVEHLFASFRGELSPGLEAYADRALSLGANGSAQPGATLRAKAWVGLFAEAIRSARVRKRLRARLRSELDRLEKMFRAHGHTADAARRDSAGVLSCVVGSLVFGALMPGVAKGFSAPFLKSVIRDRLG